MSAIGVAGRRKPAVLTCIANLSNDEVFTPPEVDWQLVRALHPSGGRRIIRPSKSAAEGSGRGKAAAWPEEPLVNTTTFQANRARIPHAELMKYRGQWIAINPDGRRVVAGHADLEQLDSLVIAAGEDPETVALEHVGADDVYLGAAEHD